MLQFTFCTSFLLLLLLLLLLLVVLLASVSTYTNFLFHFPFDEIYLSASSPLSAFLLLLQLLLLLLQLLVVLLPSVRLVYKIFFFIFRLMRYTDVCFFFTLGRSLSA